MSLFLRITSRPRILLAITALLLAAAGVIGGGLTDRLQLGGTEDPAAESSRALTVLNEKFPASQPNLVLLVRSGRDGRDGAATARQGTGLAQRLSREEGITGVLSYWQTKDPALRSKDGEHALIVAHIKGDETRAGKVYDRIADKYRATDGGLEVKLGGNVAVRNEAQRQTADDLVRSELIAMPIVLVILLLAFGSVIAALLPFVIGLVAIFGTNALLVGITHVADVSIFAQNLTTALGFGLAIDYALLIVRRYREELVRHPEPARALVAVMHSAGRTVLFSASVVAVSLAAMLIFPMYFLRSFAYAGISVVVLAALAALTVLPALLLLLGHRVNSLKVFGRRRGEGDGAAAERRWRSTTAAVMKRGPLVTVVVTAFLVLLGLPFLRVDFGTVDDRQLGKHAEARFVHDEIRESFTNSPTGGIAVLAEGADRAGIDRYARQLSRVAKVARVDTSAGTFRGGSQVRPADAASATRLVSGTNYLTVWPDHTVEDISADSQRMVRDIRSLDAPFPVRVGGQAAMLVDSRHVIGELLPYALLFIVVVTMIMVFLMTGSLLLPLQAVILNALSLTAMFGAAVWVFQDGHLSGLLGFTPTGFIETSLPVLMFCLTFGLSMDYSLFLLSRIKEHYDRTGDHRDAVLTGVARTGGIITAAAVILAVVMAGIGTSQIALTKMLGLGTALAVLVDATVVRCLLVPALMGVFGRSTWWAPHSLRRFRLREEVPDDTTREPAPADHGGPNPPARQGTA
ncbi:MMPL family transporter [Streptomyces sp. NPDC029674]|uniref:MMPL family transporter n=1 Tax=Streptomyces sp. NPDC029674 TaxID=3365297 RepID=UPI00384D2A18